MCYQNTLVPYISKIIILYLGSNLWGPPVKAAIITSSEKSAEFSVEKLLTSDGYWCSEECPQDSSCDADLTFMFPTSVTVDGFRIATADLDGFGVNIFDDFTLEVSSDGATWESVLEGEGQNLECCDWQEFTFEMTTAKYFRLSMTGNQGGWYIALGELQFRWQLG